MAAPEGVEEEDRASEALAAFVPVGEASTHKSLPFQTYRVWFCQTDVY